MLILNFLKHMFYTQKENLLKCIITFLLLQIRIGEIKMVWLFILYCSNENKNYELNDKKCYFRV